ncbi:MAG: fibronectin type III domain-containing protein [Paludibacteraceae bacterium]|nr:fibronectin type III domain-containing protein [Paludibacteraceae bacterium]
MKQIADSLQAIGHFPPSAPKAKVRNIQVKNNKVKLYTNTTISCVSFSPSDLRRLKRKVSLWVLGHPDGDVSIYSDGYELDELISSQYRQRDANDRYCLPYYRPMVSEQNRPWSASSGLDGRHIAISPSHGVYYNVHQNTWMWQRATVWTVVEDLFSSELANQWLVPMLENAGAYIFEPRERDVQVNERILFVDETDNKKENLIRTQVPEEGQYGIYYKASANTQEAVVSVSIVHQGIRTDYKVRTNIGQGVWQWIGSHYFGMQSDSNYILVKGQGIEAFRLGGGMGTIRREGELSDLPRWEEAARYWLEYAGYPNSVWDNNESADDYKDDLQSRGLWVNYLTAGSACNPKGEGLKVPVELCLALHTDGEREEQEKQMSGTLAIYTNHNNSGAQQFPTGVTRLINRDLGDYVQTQITQDMTALTEHSWRRRELKNGNYCESRYPDIPTLLLEVLSHYNLRDMHYGLNPKYQYFIMRSVYKGILRYLHRQENSNYTIQPHPVKDMQLTRSGDQLTLTWQPNEDILEPSATPTYYIVYTRCDNSDWDNGKRISSTTYTMKPKRGKRYDFRVAAGNDGGRSLFSETLSAYLAPKEKGCVLIVNGFNRVDGPEWFMDSTFAGIVPDTYTVPYLYSRAYIGNQFEFDRRKKWKSDDNCGLGMCYRDYQENLFAGNTFDYPVLHGAILAANDYSYVSTNVTALTTIDPSFSFVDVILGKEQQPFPQNLQSALTQYINNGGRTLISGAYVGHLSKRADKLFATNTLRYTTKASRASHSGVVRLWGKRYTLVTTPDAFMLHTSIPDGISPTDHSVASARYEDTRMSAGVSWRNGNARTLVFSFPLESITQFDSIYLSALRWLTE